MTVFISAHPSGGYFVKSVKGDDTSARSTCHGYCYTLWGARRLARRVAASYKSGTARDFTDNVVVEVVAPEISIPRS